MMGRAFGGWLGAALVVVSAVVGAAGCGSSSSGNNKCATTGTTTGGLGGGLGGTMCTTMTTSTGNGNQCQAPAGSDTCTVCLTTSCCSQLLACADDTVCAGCGSDATCYEGNQSGASLLTCAQNSCATQCN